MQEFRVLSPTAILGYGFPLSSFEEGMKRHPLISDLVDEKAANVGWLGDSLGRDVGDDRNKGRANDRVG